MRQNTVEQQHVGAGVDREMQVAFVGRRRAARVDDDDLRTAFPPCGQQALVEYRVAPGGVRPRQNEEISLLKILIGARHNILAEGAAVAGDGGGHAEPGIGVDVAGADEALHQLVGDVIVLSEKLP